MTKEPVTDDPIGAVATLAEPTRRRLYDLVVASREPVGRDDAVTALGISRELAAFHLDRLVEVGLLQTEFRRRSGRTGPGAGRPAKFYRRADRDLEVSLPPRHYERAADLMATGARPAVRCGFGRRAGEGGAGPRDPGRGRRSGTAGCARRTTSFVAESHRRSRPVRLPARCRHRRHRLPPELPVQGARGGSPRPDLRDEPRLGGRRRRRPGRPGRDGRARSRTGSMLRRVPRRAGAR